MSSFTSVSRILSCFSASADCTVRNHPKLCRLSEAAKMPPCVIRCPIFLMTRLCPYPGGLAFEQWNKSNGATKEEATVSLVQWSNIHPELIFYGRSTTHTFPDLETCAVLSASGLLHAICTCTLIA